MARNPLGNWFSVASVCRRESRQWLTAKPAIPALWFLGQKKTVAGCTSRRENLSAARGNPT
jgi:hypothetical protein